jgi:hypothetical protein
VAYKIAGQAVELCSCNTPCPCAFGQEPSRGYCQGFVLLDIHEGNLNDVKLDGTKAVMAVNLPGVWTAGNWKAALILDAGNSEAQNDALKNIFGGQEGGDAADMAALVGEMVSLMVEKIDMDSTGPTRSVRIGNLVDAAGEVTPGQDPNKSIDVVNANYFMSPVSVGTSTKVKSEIPGLSFEHSGSGMWFGPFQMTG